MKSISVYRLKAISFTLFACVMFSACAPAASTTPPKATEPGRVEVPQIPQERMDLQAQRVEGYTIRPGQRDFSENLLQQLRLPEGFEINVFAQDLENPRMLAIADDGTIFVTERDAGRVRALRDRNGDGRADEMPIVATDLEDVHGLAVWENQLYMVTNTELYVAELQADGSLGEPQRLVDDLPDGGQHPNRTLAFGPDNSLYLSVGSTCNACDEPNPEHATLLRMQPDGSDRTIFAEGLRNTIGFTWHPQTHELWGMDHGSDMRGNDIPPEELNRIVAGEHYGWPFCYGDREPDFLLSSDPEEMTKQAFCAKTVPMVMGYQPHAAPMAMLFYNGTQFPEEYRGDALVAMRGSWNRNPPVGYKIVRIRFDAQGKPMQFEDFASGWLIEDGRAHFGRLVGLVVAHDGSLIVSDDANGVIYRIVYTDKAAR